MRRARCIQVIINMVDHIWIMLFGHDQMSEIIHYLLVVRELLMVLFQKSMK